MIYVDLFSGIGGFHKGIVDADIKIDKCYFSEIDTHATKIYKKHFPDSIELGNIKQVDGTKLGKVDLLTFGFPCQDLSVAGKRAGLEGARSGLFFEATRLIRECKPVTFIFENVAGLLSADEGKAIEIVIESLVELGYTVDIGMMNTSWYLPQNRERVYGIGGSWLWIFQGLIESGMTERSVFSKSIIEGYLLRKFLLNLDEAKKLREINYIVLDLNLEVKKLFELDGQRTRLEYLKIIKLWQLEYLKNFCQDIRTWVSEQKDLRSKHLLKKNLQEIVVDIKSDMNDSKVAEELYSFIEKLLNELSEESLNHMNKFIMLTWIKIITQKKIFTCAEIEGITQSYIITLNRFLPDYLNDVSLDLIKKMENIIYAENNGDPSEGYHGELFDELSLPKGTRFGYETIGHLAERGGCKVFPIGEISQESIGELGGVPALQARDYKGIGNQAQGLVEVCAMRGRNPKNPSDRMTGSPTEQRIEINSNGTTNALTSVSKDNLIICPWGG